MATITNSKGTTYTLEEDELANDCIEAAIEDLYRENLASKKRAGRHILFPTLLLTLACGPSHNSPTPERVPTRNIRCSLYAALA